MSIRIITDSASDMTPAEHPALRVLPLSVTFGTDVYMDGVDIDHQRFYEMLVERDELPKTGQVNPYAFSQAIAEAREKGDLSENAEYDAARESQAFIEGRILELESKIAQFQVIDPTTLPDNGKVVFSATVTIEDVETGNRQTVQIVGNDESDTKLGRISVASPMARALIGKSEGDEVEVQAPGGLSEYEIISVQYI